MSLGYELESQLEDSFEEKSQLMTPQDLATMSNKLGHNALHFVLITYFLQLLHVYMHLYECINVQFNSSHVCTTMYVSDWINSDYYYTWTIEEQTSLRTNTMILLMHANTGCKGGTICIDV